MHKPTTLVINWHLTEVCNYRCQYCYATWNESSHHRELIHNPEKTIALMSELHQFFKPSSHKNILGKKMEWNAVRINFAGGEPLLYTEKIPSIINHAKELGFEVSMITNGSQLSEDLLGRLAPQLSWLGISIDSINPVTNNNIGRIDRRGRLLNYETLAQHLIDARKSNPNLRIKLNTVVNQLNYHEDLSTFIKHLAPNKWKVLRMLPVVNHNLTVSDEQFKTFVTRHHEFHDILSVEDNHDMHESYLMIDPYGRFFQNKPQLEGQGYNYSQPILEVGAAAAFAKMTFDIERFIARYVVTKSDD
ncbi:viperin family antiviral radical SAM protein [Leeia sp. TBRC 13508]|uniref:S-adenosylmethionine-dependent nucleotide dehydratase n=1 Tax=Leeia speluncae TaxID=2884804 RepID=A0ABS8DAQ4_9NEIS|nr:viperin family antiviral radical SAM protein [Leeia speluncae]MCB6185083.1 viperin family antiviral radical SAM protein [Leeia speluncae]